MAVDHRVELPVLRGLGSRLIGEEPGGQVRRVGDGRVEARIGQAVLRRAGHGVGERVVVGAAADAGGAGLVVAVRPAEAAQGELQPVGEGVIAGGEELVPAPGQVGVPVDIVAEITLQVGAQMPLLVFADPGALVIAELGIAAGQIGPPVAHGHERAAEPGRKLGRVRRLIGRETRIGGRDIIEERFRRRSGHLEQQVVAGRQHRGGHRTGGGVGRCRVGVRDFGVRIGQFRVQLGAREHVGVELGVDLVAVLLLLQIVPDRVLGAAVGGSGPRRRHTGAGEHAAKSGAA